MSIFINKNICFFIIISHFLLPNIFCGVCGFDQLKKKEKLILENLSMSNKLRNLNGQIEYQPISFYVDYSFMSSQSRYSSRTSIVQKSLANALDLFQRILLTLPPTTISLNASQALNFCEVPFVSEELEEGVEASVVIFPMFTKAFKKGTLAAATSCGLEKIGDKSYKPRVGVLYVSSYLDVEEENAERYLTILFLHEITHILVFDTNLFPLFTSGNPVKTTVVNGYTRSVISSPKVLEKSRLHFACSSVVGVELENQGLSGTAGVHWEARVMMGDYMIALHNPDNAISDITLALFEDSGWYKPQYYTGGLFKFGKGEGCSFLTKRCFINHQTRFPNEFCSVEDEPRCVTSLNYKSQCYITSYSGLTSDLSYLEEDDEGGLEFNDYCPTAYNEVLGDTKYMEGHCQYGLVDNAGAGEILSNTSFCVQSSLGTGGSLSNICAKATKCLKSSKTYILSILDKEIECPTKGGALENPSGLSGSILCPGYNFVCAGTVLCNDIESCIRAKSKADTDTYLFDYEVGNAELKAMDDVYEEKGRYLVGQVVRIVMTVVVMLF